MQRLFTILLGTSVAVGSLFVISGVAYLTGGLLEHVSPGLSWVSNLLILMLLFVMVIATLLTVAERKWSALMQDRIGPNRATINLPGLRNRPLFGIPHVAADALKMIFKEDTRPAVANSFLFTLGPILSFAPIFALFAVVPAGPTVRMVANIPLLAHSVAMVVSQPDFGMLYVFAIASLAVYGTSLAGWASNNKFALLGGVRAASQMISYEVALGLSLVGLMAAFSTVRLPEMVGTIALAAGDKVQASGQAAYLWHTVLPGFGDNLFLKGFDIGLPAWGFLLQPVGFIAFFAASFAETKRAPFDLPEGESEIIGYFVEYSGMKFGVFMISEFIEVVVLSGLITALFFGGYHLPFGEAWLSHFQFFQENGWAFGALLGGVFWVKVLLLIWLQLMIRWTFPRFRYDQIQTLGWKMLLPAGLVNLFISAALILLDPTLQWLGIVGMVEIGIVVALTMSSNPLTKVEHGHPALPAAAHASALH